jgi:hypothetical protein
MHDKKVDKQRLAIATMTAIALLTTTVISMATTENAFAYNKNQVASQANDCGNGDTPFDVFCQNLASQIQGDRNTVGIAASQGFAEDGNGPPPPPRDECIECFDPLSDAQVQQLADVLAERFGLVFPTNPTRAQILDIICEALEQGPPPPGLVPGQINGALNQVDGVSNSVRQAIHACLNDLF